MKHALGSSVLKKFLLVFADVGSLLGQSFKEMVAMCLVKEPTRRPTAERLLRHSFFKHARSPDYIYRHVLDGLPPLAERVRNLKVSKLPQVFGLL